MSFSGDFVLRKYKEWHWGLSVWENEHRHTVSRQMRFLRAFAVCLTRPDEQDTNIRKNAMFQVLSSQLNEMAATCTEWWRSGYKAGTGIRSVGRKISATLDVKVGRPTTPRGYSSRQLGPKPDAYNSLLWWRGRQKSESPVHYMWGFVNKKIHDSL
jgi:hypothetical protein